MVAIHSALHLLNCSRDAMVSHHGVVMLALVLVHTVLIAWLDRMMVVLLAVIA
jgi:hypothetical protein